MHNQSVAAKQVPYDGTRADMAADRTGTLDKMIGEEAWTR